MNIEYQIIKKNDNFCIDETKFMNLLGTNKNYIIDKDKKTIKYKSIFIKYSINKEISIDEKDIIFIINFEIDDIKHLNDFEKFDKSFLDFMKKFNNDFSLNILWDDISKYYAENIYPKIFCIEILLRKLIYYFMGKNVGINWTKECFPKDVEKSIKDVKDKNKTETDENILYYADFIQLKNFLFIRYPNKFIEQDKFIEKLKMDDYNKDTIIKDFEYKSNWDRYFESIIDKGELEENLGELYKYRSLVAHNRKIRLNESERTESLTNQVKKTLEKCLDKINDIKVPENEKENFENVSSRILNINYNETLSWDSNYFTHVTLQDFGLKNLVEQNAIIKPFINAKINLYNNPAIQEILRQEETLEKITKNNKIIGSTLKLNKNYLIGE